MGQQLAASVEPRQHQLLSWKSAPAVPRSLTLVPCRAKQWKERSPIPRLWCALPAQKPDPQHVLTLEQVERWELLRLPAIDRLRT